MKIAFSVPSLGFSGGLERYAHSMAGALRERGHSVVLVHGAGKGRDPTGYVRAFDAAVPLERAAELSVDVVYVQKARGLPELAVWGNTPMLLAAHDHDLTCPRSHRYLPYSQEPCDRVLGISCVAHGCVVTRERREGTFPLRVVNPFAQRRELSALARRARLVACSSYIARGLLEAGAPLERVEVLYPVPPVDPRPIERLPGDRKLVVVGSLVRGKGFDLAIEALGTLPPDVELSIAGEGSAERELRALAQRVAPGRVHFLGALPFEQVGPLYDSARVVLVPSRWPEPFGMVGLEALARGRPVVAARHGGIPEWLVDGEGGALFAPGSSVALASAVLRVLDDQQLFGRALERARSFGSFAKSVMQLEGLLQQELEAGRFRGNSFWERSS